MVDIHVHGCAAGLLGTPVLAERAVLAIVAGCAGVGRMGRYEILTCPSCVCGSELRAARGLVAAESAFAISSRPIY